MNQAKIRVHRINWGELNVEEDQGRDGGGGDNNNDDQLEMWGS